MTKNQIEKALKKAGIETSNLTIERDEVEICVGYHEANGFGFCNTDKTAALTNRVKAVLKWGGFSTGYGATILQARYISQGDWNSTDSRCHY